VPHDQAIDWVANAMTIADADSILPFAAASEPERIAALQRLLAIQLRSFPMYLSSARPWSQPGSEEAIETLGHIVANQRQMAERIVEALVQREADVDTGHFPMAFTDTHDLSLDYLLGELVRYQERDVQAIGDCVRQLAGDPPLHELAQEALGAAKGHLDTLVELRDRLAQHKQ
jgi:hypothetical protein